MQLRYGYTNQNMNLTPLTLWDRVTHIYVGTNTNIGSDNGLSPGRRQAIIWTNAGLLIGPLATNFSEILIEILAFSFKNALEDDVCEMACILSRSQCVKQMGSWCCKPLNHLYACIRLFMPIIFTRPKKFNAKITISLNLTICINYLSVIDTRHGLCNPNHLYITPNVTKLYT